MDGPLALEATVRALAASQHWVLPRWQLLALGFGKRAIEHRLATGRLHRLHRGVYAYGRADVSRRGMFLAAVLACGDGAVLSHRSAGVLWAICAAPGRPVHVSSTRRAGHADPLIALHRTRLLASGDRALRDRIPVTSLHRTLVDLAGILDADELRDAFEEADRQNLLQLAAVAGACERSRGRRGVGALRALVAEALAPELKRSVFEDRFMHFCRRFDLPLPAMNAPVLGFTVDALWAKRRVIVELDSWEHHGKTRAAFENDRARDAKLTLAGYRVYRLTWRRLEREPQVVATELLSLLGLPALVA